MNDEKSHQEGDVDDSKENKATHHHHERTSDTSKEQEEDVELGKSHSRNDCKKQSKSHRDEGVANLKNDADCDDFIECLADIDAKHTLESSDRDDSLMNKSKRVVCCS